MAPWAFWQFAFALVVAIGWFALAIGELHISERAEEQEWHELQGKIASTQ